jgi:hypothetical protein
VLCRVETETLDEWSEDDWEATLDDLENIMGDIQRKDATRLFHTFLDQEKLAELVDDSTVDLEPFHAVQALYDELIQWISIAKVMAPVRPAVKQAIADGLETVDVDDATLETLAYVKQFVLYLWISY